MIKFIDEAPFDTLGMKGKTITLISGMAGIGSVGKIAVDAIKDQFKAELVLSMYIDDLPAQVIVDEKGNLILPVIQAFLAKPTSQHFFLLVTGEYQPSTNNGMFTFIDSLMTYLLETKGLKISLIASIGAYITDQIPLDPKIHVAGSDDLVIAQFTGIDKDKIRVMENGVITGANGLIPAWGKLVGIPGVCLLAETIPVVKKDPRAARLVIEMLSKHFEFPFDFMALVQSSEEVELVLNDMKKRTRSMGEVMGQNADKDRQSYIG